MYKSCNLLKLKNNNGTALFMTLIILTSILTVSLAIADLVRQGVKISGVQGNSTIAYFAAEAGAERALWEARKNSYTLPSGDQSNLFEGNLSNNSVYHVNYAISSSLVTFTSIGVYFGVRRSVETSFQTY